MTALHFPHFPSRKPIRLLSCFKLGLSIKRSQSKGRAQDSPSLCQFLYFLSYSLSSIFSILQYQDHISHQHLEIIILKQTMEVGRSMSVLLLYRKLSQGQMADFPAFKASKSFHLFDLHSSNEKQSWTLRLPAPTPNRYSFKIA